MKQPISYGRQYISDEDIQAVVETLKSDYLTCGPAILNFEKAFAEYVQADYTVAVCNATAALHIAAMALGVHSGDTVICSPMTFASSANCIRFCGGNVKFVDINPQTYLLDIDKLKETLAASPQGTYKGMVLVDFAGYPHNMEEYRKVADEYGMWILEDACHAPGAYFIDSTGEKVYCGCGKYSDITVFSFHPVKHITTGEGGMACTRFKELYEKMALYRTHGITHDSEKMERLDGLWYYEMQELGFNYRLTDIQAALGISQLKRARHNVEIRRELVHKYNEAFVNIEGFKIPFEAVDVYHAYHLYIIQVEDRLGLYNFLRENNIYAQVLYYPLNLMPYYRQLGNKEGDLPIVEDYYKHCLALPMFPTLTEEQQQYVIAKVKEFIL
ncbi:MAG TPA: UDP-4-amino-4,6-dideoxy-N-acetyl-beta-L-altrosamine transaminase [Parabacteroides distasonis]|jgi:UDP-4-amino-4,6-dideoxy-N-acetyl-beta-L-altrosamine transaminase|nr:UDP-4-amino-4,6-dideoxy-N-acetyl-beta-L-altrosamine transaminase [Parabacteroides distasonis]